MTHGCPSVPERADHPLAEAGLYPAEELPGEGDGEAAPQLRVGCDALGDLGAAAVLIQANWA